MTSFGVAFAAMGLILLAAPGTLGAVKSMFDAPTPPEVSASDAIPPDTPIPSLSSDQQNAASALLARDPSLRGILGANRYTISELGPWTGEQGQLLGAAAVLELEKPLSSERAWPLIRYDHQETSTPPYRARIEHMIVRNATQVDALVDFNSGKVVSLQPGGEGVTVAPGSDVVARPSAGD